MKRWVILLSALFVVFSLIACDTAENGKNAETVIIEEKYDENGNILVEPLYMGWNLWYYNAYTYNQEQKILSVTRYTEDNIYLEEEKYIYRGDGTLEKVECYWENFDFEIELWQEKLYDESGLLYKIQNYESGAISDYYTFAYDSQRRCIKESYYDIQWNDGEYPQSYVVYTYDDAGNCIRKDELDQNEEQLFYWTYSYDAKGHVTVENKIQLVNGEAFTSVTEYTYHDNGRVKDKIFSGYGGRSEETWDATGALISEKHYETEASGELFLKYSVEYSSELKIWTTYLKDGRYKTESAKGNAEVTSWMELAYYNPDGTLFCTNHEGVFYDPSGKRMEPTIDMLSPWDAE